MNTTKTTMIFLFALATTTSAIPSEPENESTNLLKQIKELINKSHFTDDLISSTLNIKKEGSGNSNGVNRTYYKSKNNKSKK